MNNIANLKSAATPDYRALFEATSVPYLVLTPDFTIAAVNEAYLQASKTKREDILGRGVFEIFPDNPDDPHADGVANLGASLNKVLAEKMPHSMAIQKYDIPVAGEGGTTFEERYWNPVNTPVFDGRGEVMHIIHRVNDVTELFQGQAREARMSLEISANSKIIKDLQQLAELFKQAPSFMALLTGPNHRFYFVNAPYLKLIGHRDVMGKTVVESLPDAAAQGYVALLDEVYRSGKPYVANSAKYAMQSEPGGPISERHVDFVFQPIRGDDEQVTGILVQGVDVTGRVMSDIRRDALIRLTDELRDKKTPEDIAYIASEILGESLGVSRVGYGTIDHDAETLTVDRDWNAPGVETLAGTLNLRDYGSFIDDLKLGKFIAIHDVDKDCRTADAASALKGRSAGSFVNVPILEQGRLVAVIFVNHAAARHWLPEDLALIKEVAERTRTASERLRNALALQQSEARFRNIANAMPQMVWSTRPDGYHDYFNQRWLDFTGLPGGAIDREQWIGLFHPEDLAGVRAAWRHSLSTGDTYEIQFRLRHHSGTYRWALGRALPVRDKNGAITRWIGSCTDIEQQKQVENELAILHAQSERRRRLYETMLDNSPDLGYVFDLNHCFTYANKVLLAMWGKTWDEAIGKSFLDLGYEPWHAEMHDREIEQVKATKQAIKGEVPFAGAFGRRIYEYIFVPVIGPNGEVEAIAGTTRDVTERKENEDSLRESNRRKDEFLAMLAHELRNPLAPINAAAQALGVLELDEERVREASAIICRQVRHMTGLIDDLLDVSRVTRGLIVLDKAPHDVKEIIYNALEQVRPLIESHHHHLTLDLGAEPAYMLGDEKRLVQIASNLLNNAAKYTPNGGSIHLSMETAKNHIAIHIQDNGIGIAPELQPHIFELFTQAERTADRSQGGLGIGLAVVKNLAEMHGGKVVCLSEGVGKGCRFTLTFPRLHQAESSAPGQPNITTTQKATRKRRILVVDDNADAATMLALHLELMGHEVLIEHSGGRALERAALENPDVYILDIGLPDMDGNELARRLRGREETGGTLLIAVTGYGQEQDKLGSREAGFDHHLVKPVDTRDLLKLIA